MNVSSVKRRFTSWRRLATGRQTKPLADLPMMPEVMPLQWQGAIRAILFDVELDRIEVEAAPPN
jgi:hypothetical protein